MYIYVQAFDNNNRIIIIRVSQTIFNLIRHQHVATPTSNIDQCQESLLVLCRLLGRSPSDQWLSCTGNTRIRLSVTCAMHQAVRALRPLVGNWPIRHNISTQSICGMGSYTEQMQYLPTEAGNLRCTVHTQPRTPSLARWRSIYLLVGASLFRYFVGYYVCHVCSIPLSKHRMLLQSVPS